MPTSATTVNTGKGNSAVARGDWSQVLPLLIDDRFTSGAVLSQDKTPPILASRGLTLSAANALKLYNQVRSNSPQGQNLTIGSAQYVITHVGNDIIHGRGVYSNGTRGGVICATFRSVVIVALYGDDKLSTAEAMGHIVTHVAAVQATT